MFNWPQHDADFSFYDPGIQVLILGVNIGINIYPNNRR